METKYKMLVAVPPGFMKEGTIFYIRDLLKSIQGHLDKYIADYDIVSCAEEYDALPLEKR